MPAYTRWIGGIRIVNEARVGDVVGQIAYGKGLGRLEDCGRTGVVVAVNRVRVVVDFGGQYGERAVHPDVLRLDMRAEDAEAARIEALAEKRDAVRPFQEV